MLELTGCRRAGPRTSGRKVRTEAPSTLKKGLAFLKGGVIRSGHSSVRTAWLDGLPYYVPCPTSGFPFLLETSNQTKKRTTGVTRMW